MGYPLNAEGYVEAESAPVEPLSEDLEATGRLETNDAGVEVAPTLSHSAVDAIESLAARMHGTTDSGAHAETETHGTAEPTD